MGNGEIPQVGMAPMARRMRATPRHGRRACVRASAILPTSGPMGDNTSVPVVVLRGTCRSLTALAKFPPGALPIRRSVTLRQVLRHSFICRYGIRPAIPF